jgi:hypothetical protein
MVKPENVKEGEATADEFDVECALGRGRGPNLARITRLRLFISRKTVSGRENPALFRDPKISNTPCGFQRILPCGSIGSRHKPGNTRILAANFEA